MKELTKKQTVVLAAGAVLMVVGAMLSVFGLLRDTAAVVFMAGALFFATMQFMQTYEGGNIAISRLRRILVFSDICFIAAGLLMLENAFKIVYPLMATSIDGYNAYVHYIYNNWVVPLLIGAILQVYVTYRLSSETKKSAS